jgi:hypothetical protein
MTKIIKWIGLALVAFLVIGQFFRIDKANPEIVEEQQFDVIEEVPATVMVSLRAACFDCHSNESKYPWYSNVAPISWMVAKHIREGRAELNFSEWGKYGNEKRGDKLEEAIEETEEGEMPMKPYALLHGEANLSDAAKSEMISAFQTIMTRYPGSEGDSDEGSEHEHH